jgi:hypothetical protein
MIDIDYYLSIINKTFNVNLSEPLNYNFESKLYKIYTKKNSKYILNLLIVEFGLSDLKIPK